FARSSGHHPRHGAPGDRAMTEERLRQAERELRESNERFRMLVEGAKDLVSYRVRYVPEVRCEYVSNGVQAILGISPDALYAGSDRSCRTSATSSSPSTATGTWATSARRSSGSWDGSRPSSRAAVPSSSTKTTFPPSAAPSSGPATRTRRRRRREQRAAPSTR